MFAESHQRPLACENEQALNVDLKGRMNFSGWVMYVPRTLVEFEMQICF